MYSPDSLPWLAAAQALMRKTRESGRMPHGLLIQAVPGLGVEILAHWIARLVMCGASERQPCGECKSCKLLTAGCHPDLLLVNREEDAKQLQVDQIRGLCADLALKSYSGGYKVALICEADLMNANAANALLKTLEEPPPSTLLILCSARPSRLPATIVSRCQKVKVAIPPKPAALEWLKGQQPNQQWSEVLEHAAGAPLRALELADGGFAELNREMQAAVAALQQRRLNILETAERWSKDNLSGRLSWLEGWLSTTLRGMLISPTDLPSGRQAPKIRGLYALLDRVRGLKLEQSTSLNMQLAAEELLLRTEAALCA